MKFWPTKKQYVNGNGGKKDGGRKDHAERAAQDHKKHTQLAMDALRELNEQLKKTEKIIAK